LRKSELLEVVKSYTNPNALKMRELSWANHTLKLNRSYQKFVSLKVWAPRKRTQNLKRQGGQVDVEDGERLAEIAGDQDTDKKQPTLRFF
jgi:hypothetical protein